MSDTSESTVVTKDDELRRAKEAIAGPVPLIPDAPNGNVELPMGFRYGGVYQTKAEVRELTGADEEILARTTGWVEFFDAMIGCGTVRIGDFDMEEMPVSERRGALQTLLLGERERLFLAVLQATYGDTKTINFTCGQCSAEQEVDLILSEDLKVKEVDDLKASYEFVTSKGDKIEFRLVNGTDHMEALKDDKSSVAEQNSLLLSRCIAKVNGGLIPDQLAYARRMPVRDRQALLKELVSHQPGVDMEVMTRCARCQNEQRLALGWGDLFPS